MKLMAMLAVISMLASCTPTFKVSKNMMNHMIALDRDGKSFKIKKVRKSYVTLDDQIKDIIKNIADERRKHGTRNILIYVHGGMTGIKKSMKATPGLLGKIQGYGKHEYYPILVNWQSGIGTAYWDHLVRIRQGKIANVLGPLSSPFYLIADAGRALTRLPITWGYQAYNMLKSPPVAEPLAIARYNDEIERSAEGQPGIEGDKISLGENTWGVKDYLYDSLTYAIPGVAKVVTTPLLDMVGTSAWGNMLRRTQTVFRDPMDFTTQEDRNQIVTEGRKAADMNNVNLENRSGGGLSKLMEALRRLKKEFERENAKKENAKKEKPYTVTLIAHSMGSIILNELLRRYGDPDQDFEYTKIVYMAPACTIRDFANSVIPYLQKHESAEFYNLTLHPVAEERENLFFDVLPRGSLLSWIDDFASDPASFMELTLGQWNNAMLAYHIIPDEVRNRVVIKGFGIEDPKTNIEEEEYKKPQKHMDFNDVEMKFWQPEFWRKP